LIEKLLKFDPAERITAAEALRHPFFKDYHEYIEEDFPDIKGREFDQSFEEPDLSEIELLRLIYHELKEFHPEIYSDEDALRRYDEAYREGKQGSPVKYKVSIDEQDYFRSQAQAPGNTLSDVI